MAGASYGSLPFREQIDFFRRKVNLNTRAWTDVWQAMHDHAFVVAGANRSDLVADFREAIDKAIAQGATLAEFRKDFDSIVAQYGWDYNGGRNWRSRVIYETNLRTSYAAGRWAQLQDIKAVRPYWQYVHSDAVAHPRPLHLAWGAQPVILHADDPWWRTHYPPNGWGCQCSVRALAERDLKKLGIERLDPAPPDDMQDVTVGGKSSYPQRVQTPAGVDPGFGYAPGRDAFEQLVQWALLKTDRLPAPSAAVAAVELLSNVQAQLALDTAYAEFQAQTLARTGMTRNLSMAIGALDPEIVTAMTAQGILPESVVLSVRDVEVWHALRTAKADAITAAGEPKAFAPEELVRMPSLIRSASVVLLDQADNVLLFVSDAERRGAGKLVFRYGFAQKTTDGKIVGNWFRTAGLVKWADIRAGVHDGTLIVLKGAVK